MGQLTARRGDDWRYTGAVAALGEAYPLVDCALWLTIKADVTDADEDAVAQATWASGGDANGITVADETSGTFVVTFPATETAAWDGETEYVYDVQLRTAAGRIVTIDEGTLVVRGDVTRATELPAPAPEE